MARWRQLAAPRWQYQLRTGMRSLRHGLAEGRRQATMGVGCVVFGIGVGYALRPVDYYLLSAIRALIVTQDGGQLLYVAAQITALNMLRVLPLYLGAFVLMEAWVPEAAPKGQRLLGYLVPAVVIPGSYLLIRLVSGTKYDFGVPAALSLLGAVAVHVISRFRQGAFVKTAVFGMFIFGWQWLGVAPLLTGYGFGNGDLSLELKAVAEFLGQESLLNRWSGLSWAVFIGVAFVMAKFMVDYANHVALLERHQEQEMALQQSALRHLGARSRSEMQALVHDLKTPLTTIQGLVSVLGMTRQGPKDQEYVARVEQSVERMNHMISEILHPETRQLVLGVELVRFLQAHVSGADVAAPRAAIRFIIGADLPTVEVNLVRMTRALANIIQNAQEAAMQSFSGRTHGVVVRVGKVGRRLRFRIIDRGVGIDRERMQQLFTPGFSTKDSSGLGLSFARDVIVNDHGGELRVYSAPQKGTCIVVSLGGVEL